MFDEAAKAFQKSLTTDQLNLQQETYYNLGNTQYRQGQQTEKTNPKQTISTWQQAIQSYDAALQLKLDDADSQYNRDFVKKKLEKLQQQQQSKENKDQKDKDQKNQEQAKQDQNSQDQKNQGQAKQDQKSQDQKNQGQQQQAGNQPDQPKPDAGKGQSDQQAKAGEQPQPPKPNGQDQANAQPKQADSEESAETQAVPGQMTREEAKALLNSLKSDEHQLPAAPVSRSGSNNDDTPPVKDW